MWKIISNVLIAALVVSAIPLQATEPAPEEAIAAVLDAFHTAASEADGETYFGLLADEAIYIGTDAGERWSADEFRSFADPYFSTGRGWTYTATERHVDLAPIGTVAWFDELLWNDSYGTCRGTGVLLLTDEGWRIAQYHLTFPIPNDLAKEFTTKIKEHDAAVDSED